MATPDRTGTRVNLTLSDEVIRVLDRIGKVTGTGRATMIREILDEAAPQLGEMARALEEAQRGNVDAALRSIGSTVREVSDMGQQLDLEIKRDRRRAARKKIK
jgi:predicted DNA-binding protein